MERRAAFFFANGLAASSRKTYKAGENRYIGFCQRYSIVPLPVSESGLCKFVTFLAEQGLKYSTIKTYLAGIRYLHIRSGLQEPFHGVHMPRLEYTTRGIKRFQAQSMTGGRTRLPITPPIMRQMKEVWLSTAMGSETKMVWAACCIAFFGFLRIGEMTAPDVGSYDPSVHLGFGDVAVDNQRRPTFMRVTINQSKTDPFRKGVNLFLGRTNSDICPVAALLSYLACRGSRPGPLFVFADGTPLTRKRFVAWVRAALISAGVDQERYCGHSFRIGAATTAASCGIEDSVIKTLGRWESTAYLQYVRIPRSKLTGFSAKLVPQVQHC